MAQPILNYLMCILRLVKLVNTQIIRATFVTVRKRSYKYGRKKASLNLVMLDWNWKYQHELIFNNMYTDKYRNKNICMYMHGNYIPNF